MYRAKQDMCLFEMVIFMHPPCLHDYAIAAAVDGHSIRNNYVESKDGFVSLRTGSGESFLQSQKCFAVLQNHQSASAMIFMCHFIKSPLNFCLMDHWCKRVTSSTYLHSNVQRFSIQSLQIVFLSVSSPSLAPQSVPCKTMLLAHRSVRIITL